MEKQLIEKVTQAIYLSIETAIVDSLSQFSMNDETIWEELEILIRDVMKNDKEVRETVKQLIIKQLNKKNGL